jgi:hypothetical protein
MVSGRCAGTDSIDHCVLQACDAQKKEPPMTGGFES